MIMGGRSESTSECKSVTSSGRNSLSQDDKRNDLKGRKQAGKSVSPDKKNEGGEPSKLTYTSEDGLHYEPGGIKKRKYIYTLKLVEMSKRRSISRRYRLFVLLE